VTCRGWRGSGRPRSWPRPRPATGSGTCHRGSDVNSEVSPFWPSAARESRRCHRSPRLFGVGHDRRRQVLDQRAELRRGMVSTNGNRPRPIHRRYPTRSPAQISAWHMGRPKASPVVADARHRWCRPPHVAVISCTEIDAPIRNWWDRRRWDRRRAAGVWARRCSRRTAVYQCRRPVVEAAQAAAPPRPAALSVEALAGLGGIGGPEPRHVSRRTGHRPAAGRELLPLRHRRRRFRAPASWALDVEALALHVLSAQLPIEMRLNDQP
jgi:hypothetical protein